MSTVYLIPAELQEEGLAAIPPYVTEAIRQCRVFFVENERTTRRYFKQLWKTCLPGQHIVIDEYEWINMAAGNATELFRKKIREDQVIGIVSEAGCPGVADPGQALIAIAQEMNIPVKPLVGPSSILLALMASGMNGQQFKFNGYLPIDNHQRIKTLKELEAESAKKDCTQIFIETPYRNNQLIEAVLKTCHPNSLFCIATDLTGPAEWVKTKTIARWQKEKTDLHKRPAIFLLHAR
ncbi:MAG: SAM-dependent methyltransferase [Sphingobacteriales bacterium]|nr:SAM-dependent methyltransferase [Sphingobacteriales bacterium]